MNILTRILCVTGLGVISHAPLAATTPATEKADQQVIATLIAPDIKTSALPICAIALVKQRHKELQFSAETVRIADEIYQRIKPVMMQYKSEVQALQHTLFEASLAGDLALYKKTVEALSAVKLKADLRHEEAVHEGRTRFPAADVQKIDAWLKQNRETMFALQKLE